MNLETITAVSELIGAIAVVISLLYLAKQIKQSTESTNAAGFQAWQSVSAAHWAWKKDQGFVSRDKVDD